MLAGVPFRSGATLSLTYDGYQGGDDCDGSIDCIVRVSGVLIPHANQFSGVPGAGLNPDAFENDTSANCHSLFRTSNSLNQRPYVCDFSLVLSESLPQSFATQNVVIPAGTRVDFEAGGIAGLTLPQDGDFMGLPVSASTPIRVNTLTVGGPQCIEELTLSRDANYHGIPVSASVPMEFYEPGADGVAPLSRFAPSKTFGVSGAGTIIDIAGGEAVRMNQDGSFLYGELAFPQTIDGIAFPAKALIFLGDHNGTPVSSVGLQPFMSVVIGGVTYGDSIQESFFIDFDENGHVVRVR